MVKSAMARHPHDKSALTRSTYEDAKEGLLNIQTLLLAARQLPSHSALIDAPRVILRLACWNSDGRPPAPSSHNPLKLRCTHVVPLAVLPYGAEPLPRLPRMRVQGGSGAPASLRRPRSAAGGAAASVAVAVAMPPGEALPSVRLN